ncbi:hypothetical protein K501DRAFT_280651 [Backusella circina FSU 941]|nr:hypothetical protein K501DRAFT_280651 [Backusella circina FSU 941]
MVVVVIEEVSGIKVVVTSTLFFCYRYLYNGTNRKRMLCVTRYKFITYKWSLPSVKINLNEEAKTTGSGADYASKLLNTVKRASNIRFISCIRRCPAQALDWYFILSL